MNVPLRFIVAVTVLAGILSPAAWAEEAATGSWVNKPGSRVLLHAHNCYPYHGRWANRIDRALRTPLPVLIEQDLAWYKNKRTGKAWSVVSHGRPITGKEPTLREHFFERVRPIVAKALADGNKADWPLLVLHLEFKSGEPAHVSAIAALLAEHENWFCAARRVADPRKVMPIEPAPVLALTEGGRGQHKIFYDDVPVGGRILVFGNVRTHGSGADMPPDQIVTEPATNYHRWWNNAWSVVEKGGQPKAGSWTEADMERLRSLVDHAHAMGLWIRFYTLNGHSPWTTRGWSSGYNFGSPEKVKPRWRAAIEAGVDFIATDQYEEFAACRAELEKAEGR